MALALVYAFIVIRALVIARGSNDPFSRMAAAGLVVLFGLQSFINMAVNLNLIPPKGMTLPLISSGGSSLVSTFFAVGVLAGISSMNAQDEARDIELIELKNEAML